MITLERRFLPILAVVGVIIVAHQGLDIRSVTLGADLATPTGRMGLVAVLWTRGAVLLTADAFLILAAVLASWRRLEMGLAVVHLVAGAAALLEAPFFLVDAGRMVDTIGLPQVVSFRITVLRLLVALVVLGLGAVAAGVSLVQTGRAGRSLENI